MRSIHIGGATVHMAMDFFDSSSAFLENDDLILIHHGYIKHMVLFFQFIYSKTLPFIYAVHVKYCIHVKLLYCISENVLVSGEMKGLHNMHSLH